MLASKKPALYVVATPIGNLGEMTPRAINVLKNVTYIAAEDTRETGKLCAHFGIETPLVSSHEHNEFNMADKIVQDIANGQNVALVSDAGYPGVSDPGYLVINKVIQAGLPVSVISGPSAFLNALVGSGLPANHFYFHGFLPHRRTDRLKELKAIMFKEETLLFYESPHRIIDTLQDIRDVFGNRYLCVCRELTKLYEEYIRGYAEEVILKMQDRQCKGEMVIVVQGCQKEERVPLSDVEIVEEVNKLMELGKTAKDAIKEVATLHELSKNDVYKLFHQ